tara:strand:+ start:131 stop:565 length:435 start_codon:yes stop_codon:yes gene_type:complete
MFLPKDILYHIFLFGGKNTFYLDKNLLQFVKEKRNFFIQNPITIHYSLIRFTKRKTANVMRNHRPSICFESEKTIDISGNIKIGSVNQDGTIIPSEQLKNIIVPIKKEKYETITTYYSKIYYWEINNIYTLNPQSAVNYSLLWN